MNREADLAWVAGIIDGEGTMGVYFHQGHWQYRMDVTNTDLRILSRVREILGAGQIRLSKGVRTERRHCYTYVLNVNSAVHVLKAVLPYLVGKQDQANLMLEAHSYRRRIGHQHYAHPHQARLHEIAKVLRALKRQTVENPVVVPQPKPKPHVRQLMLLPDPKSA